MRSSLVNPTPLPNLDSNYIHTQRTTHTYIGIRTLKLLRVRRARLASCLQRRIQGVINLRLVVFLAALKYINDQPSLFGDITSNSKVTPTEKGDEDMALQSIKDKVLSVAQSLPHDHEPASKLGLRSVWIDRQSAVTCNETLGVEEKWTWRFETLGEMADAVEKELTAS